MLKGLRNGDRLYHVLPPSKSQNIVQKPTDQWHCHHLETTMVALKLPSYLKSKFLIPSTNTGRNLNSKGLILSSVDLSETRVSLP